jgi:hypothetical protein
MRKVSLSYLSARAPMVALFLVSSAFGVQSSNLIQNGSFEQPGFAGNAVPGQQQKVVAPSADITAWTVGGAGDIYVHEYPVGPASGFGPAEDGSYYVDLSGDGPPHATLYQDFATTPGAQYLLTFYIGSASSSPSSTISLELEGTTAFLDTTLTPLAPDAGGINWLEETFSFTPDSTITQLSFVDTSGSDDNASFLDNVSVTAVPEPAAFGVLSLGSLVLLRRYRRH